MLTKVSATRERPGLKRSGHESGKSVVGKRLPKQASLPEQLITETKSAGGSVGNGRSSQKMWPNGEKPKTQEMPQEIKKRSQEIKKRPQEIKKRSKKSKNAQEFK